MLLPETKREGVLLVDKKECDERKKERIGRIRRMRRISVAILMSRFTGYSCNKISNDDKDSEM